MKTKYVIGISVVLVAIIIFRIVFNQGVVGDYKDTSYSIEGQLITLSRGFSEIELEPGSATKITTLYFGNEIKHDLNNDGKEDVVFLLTQNRGGSGTFYYAVAALYTPQGYRGSHAFLLGDRIAPQSITIDEGMTTRGTNRENVIVINFATRTPDESFATAPTVGKSIWIKLDPETMQFGEVAQDFEG